jgi:hypothetical protein
MHFNDGKVISSSDAAYPIPIKHPQQKGYMDTHVVKYEGLESPRMGMFHSHYTIKFFV